jgi:hypothetical protein
MLSPEQKLMQAIAAPLPSTEIGVSATANFLGREADPLQVVFEARIEGTGVDYHEKEAQPHFDLHMASVVMDSHGKLVDTFSDNARGNLQQPGAMELVKQNGYRFTKFLSLKPGLYQIRIGVRDGDTDRLGTAAAWVEVPDLLRHKLTISSIFLSDPSPNQAGAAPNPAGSANETRAKEPVRSRFKQGIRFFKANAFLGYNARLYNLDATSRQGDELLMHLEIVESGRPIVQVPWQPISSRTISKEGMGTDIGGLMPLDIRPGVYEFHIEVKNPGSKELASQSVVFGVE